jgi:hypothetical protein
LKFGGEGKPPVPIRMKQYGIHYRVEAGKEVSHFMTHMEAKQFARALESARQDGADIEDPEVFRQCFDLVIKQDGHGV